LASTVPPCRARRAEQKPVPIFRNAGAGIGVMARHHMLLAALLVQPDQPARFRLQVLDAHLERRPDAGEAVGEGGDQQRAHLPLRNVRVDEFLGHAPQLGARIARIGNAYFTGVLEMPRFCHNYLDEKLPRSCPTPHAAVDDLKLCDVIMGAVDDFKEREQLERFARKHLIPYIDIGMDVHDLGKKGQPGPR
jgi:hypothetical protein